MAVDVAAQKLQKLVKEPPSKTVEEISEEAESTETVETEEVKVEESVENGEDKQEAPKEKIEGVPYDKDGKRPSDKPSIDFEQLKELLPEDVYNSVDQRFRQLYRQVSATDRYLDTLHKDFDQKLAALSEKESAKDKDIQDVKSILSELSTKDAAAQQQMQLQDLQKAKAQAYQDLDFDKVAELDIKIIQTLSQPQKAELPKLELQKAEEKKAEKDTTGELPSLTAREQAYVAEWTNEVDATGQPVRPWAQPWHPLYNYALGQTEAMLKHPQLKGANLETVLQTVDQVMYAQMQGDQQEQPKEEPKTTAKAKKPPEVLTADQNLRTKKTEDKVYLNDEQKIVSHRIFSKLPPEEAEKKYLASLIKIQKAQK